MTGSTWVVLVAAVAVVNPPRLAPALSSLAPLLPDSTQILRDGPRGESRSIRWAASVSVTALGAGLVATVLTVVAVVADRLLTAIDVSPPTLRIAAGLVLVVAVVRDLIGGRPSAEPALGGWGAAIVPVAIPLVGRPELAVLVASIATVEGVPTATAALLGIVLVTTLVAALRPTPLRARLMEWARWLLAAAGVVAAIALTVDGVYGV